MKLLGVSCGPGKISKTLTAVSTALDYARKFDGSVETEALNVCELNVQFCDARDPNDYSGDTRLIIDKVIEADALIFATPMYRGSYTAIFKNVFDLLPNDALCSKPVGLIATGGSYHHYLALEHELKPVFGFFMAFVLPGVVYMTNDDYMDGKIASVAASESLEQLAQSLVNFNLMFSQAREPIIGAPGIFMPKNG